MTLPDFLGVAAPKAGSTWLYELLAGHPDIFMSVRRKEIHFFDRYYSRGVEWYAKFFPDDASRYRAVGEFTPNYLYSERTLQRILVTLPSAPKLIVLARDPVERAYSYYLHSLKNGVTSESFHSFLANDHQAVEYGLYCKHLERCLRYFKRSQILVLIFEEAVADVGATQAAVADFLQVDRSRFETGAGEKPVYARSMPRAKRLFLASHKVAKTLRQWDLDWIVNLAGRLGIKRLFGQATLPQMDAATRRYLESVFEEDITQLERFLGRELSIWRNQAAYPASS